MRSHVVSGLDFVPVRLMPVCNADWSPTSWSENGANDLARFSSPSLLLKSTASPM